VTPDIEIPVSPANTYAPYTGEAGIYRFLTASLGHVTATFAGVPQHPYRVGQDARLGERALYISSIEQEHGTVTLHFTQRPDPPPLSPLTRRLLRELYPMEAK
jgi:hypothetical protein